LSAPSGPRWGEFTDYERLNIALRNRGNEDVERLLAVLAETEAEIPAWLRSLAWNEGFIEGWNAAQKEKT
jgi:hypothetical protein